MKNNDRTLERAILNIFGELHSNQETNSGKSDKIGGGKIFHKNKFGTIEQRSKYHLQSRRRYRETACSSFSRIIYRFDTAIKLIETNTA